MTQRLSFGSYLDLRAARTAAVDRAIASLARGDRRPAVDLFGSWRLSFAQADQVLHLLEAMLPVVTEGAVAARWGPPDELPDPGLEQAAEHIWRQRLWAAMRAGPMAPDRQRLAWALEELAFLGEEIERRQRRAWSDRTYPEDAEADARTRQLWGLWVSGQPYAIMDEWRQRYGGLAAGAFRDELAVRGVPPAVARARSKELQSSFFYHLLLGPNELEGAVPGWVELAWRVVETTGADPISALAAHLPARGRLRAAACLARRGGWPATFDLVWAGEGTTSGRVARLRRILEQDGQFLDAGLDAHVAVRVIRTWAATDVDPDRTWRVVRSNRGRARGRLRAVAALEAGEALGGVLCAMPSAHARTAAAVRWYARDWARAEIRTGFAFDDAEVLTAPCVADPPDVAELSADDEAAIQTWVMLALLRGHGCRLERWVATGTTGDRSSSWGRLLKEALARGIADPDVDSAGRARYDRLRAYLAVSLGEVLDALRQPIRALAAADPDTIEGRAAMKACLQAVWHPGVQFPIRGLSDLGHEARALMGGGGEIQWPKS